MLTGMAGAQMMLTNSTGTAAADVKAFVNAVAIGQKGYIYAIAVFDFAILFLYMVEALRTSGWRMLSTFDYNNLVKLVIATSIGGNAVGDYAVKNPATAHRAHVRVDITGRGTALSAANIDSNFSHSSDILQSDSYPLADWRKSSAVYTPVASRALEPEEPPGKAVKEKPVPRTASYEIPNPDMG